MSRRAPTGFILSPGSGRAALALIVVVAAILRLAGVHWDDGTHLHPDERFVTMVTQALGRGSLEPAGPRANERLAECKRVHPPAGVGPWLDTGCSDWSPANVGFPFYPYGILPPAAVKGAALALARAGWPDAASYSGIPTVGRIAATAADLVALWCAFLLGRAIGGRRAGLAAAALYAFAILPLQLARFFTVDPFANAFAALALVFAVRAVAHAKVADLVAFGFASGLAAACKLSLVPLLALAIPVAFLAPVRGGGPPALAPALLRASGASLVAGLAAFAIFRVAQPIVFSGPGIADLAPAPGAIETFRSLAAMMDGSADAPPAWQWIGRTRGLDPLRNLLLFGLGPSLALAAVAGVALASWRAAAGPLFRRRRSIVLLAAVLAYGAWLGTQFVSSMRYWLPLYPPLAALAGWALVTGSRALRQRVGAARRLPTVAIAIAAVWSAAWLSVPLSAPTRLWASHWMLERVPAGASAPLAGESGPLPRRLNWAIDAEVPSAPREVSAQTVAQVAGAIDRLELRLASAPAATEAFVVASLQRDDGTVLMPSTRLPARISAHAPPGFDPRDRVLVATLPSSIAVDGGAKLTLRLSTGDEPFTIAGSAIATEGAWDDPVPMSVRRLPAGTKVEPGFPGFVRAGSQAEGVDPFGQRYFRSVDLAIARRDDEVKREALARGLDEASWITISSQRFYDAVSRDPYRFPLTIRYYDALFAGRLGFDVVATFRSPPRLGPVVFDREVHPWPAGYLATRAAADANPEEALSVYDHPPVTVLRKRADYDPQRVRDILAGAVLRTLDGAKREGAPATVGRVERSPAAADVAPHLLMLSPERLGSLDAASPSKGRTMGPFAAAIAWYLVLAILAAAALPGLVALMPAQPALAYGIARIVGLLGFATAAWWATWAGLDLWRPERLAAFGVLAVVAGAIAARRFRAAFPSGWRSEALRAEAVFALLYLAAIVLRISHPDLWAPGYGGEKPMDMAILNAVLRTETFPPYDPWFSGGRLNYYYGGFVPVAALAKLTGTAPSIAANLAVAAWMAMTGAALFGLARTLALALPGASSRRGTLAGALATVAGVGIGNLGIVSALAAAPPSGTDFFARLVALATSPDPRWYWSPTRMVAERTGIGHEIHEFPFFTFLHADLHAHLLAMPLSIATWGIAGWIALDRRSGTPARLAAVALVAATTALARTANSWDWPLLTAVAAGAIVVSSISRSSDRERWRRAVGALLLFAALQLAIAWPFTSAFVTGGTGISLYRGPGTPLVVWLQMVGLFLWVLLPWLLLAPGQASNAASLPRSLAWTRAGLLAVAIVATLASAVGLALAAWQGIPAGASGAMLAVVALALREAVDARRPAARRWIASIVAVAFAVQLAPEFFVVGSDIGRQNTYFKFHLQAWLAMAIASGPAAAALLARPPGRVWAPVFAALALVALAYVPLGTAGRASARFAGERPLTLDGFAFLDSARLDRDGRSIPLSGDRAIVDWLAANAAPGDVVLEAQLPEYQYGGRIASFTGQPTPLGYRWHETQQRPVRPLGDLVNLRVANVDALWRSPDDARVWRAVLDYRIRYIVVGGLERAIYPEDALARFERWVAGGRARVAFRQGDSAIYELPRRVVDGWPVF